MTDDNEKEIGAFSAESIRQAVDREPEDGDIGECHECREWVIVTQETRMKLVVSSHPEGPEDYEDIVVCLPCQKKREDEDREAYAAYLRSYSLRAGASIEEDE